MALVHHTPSPQGTAAQDRRSFIVILAASWILTLGTAAFLSLTNPRVGLSVRQWPSGTINPNQAPWYELALLPRIGEAKARAIVSYRHDADHDESDMIFRTADELTQVSGIGPKTVRRLSRELRFPD